MGWARNGETRRSGFPRLDGKTGLCPDLQRAVRPFDPLTWGSQVQERRPWRAPAFKQGAEPWPFLAYATAWSATRTRSFIAAMPPGVGTTVLVIMAMPSSMMILRFAGGSTSPRSWS